MRKDKVDKLVEKLVHASKWATSCNTIDQLTTVKTFVDGLFISIDGTRNSRLIYNLGYTEGIIRHKEHTLTPKE